MSRGDFVAHPRHPVTGKQFTVRGRTQRELDAQLYQIESLRKELQLASDLGGDERARRKKLELVRARVDEAVRRVRFGVVTLGRAARAYAQREDLAPNTRRRIESTIASPLAELAEEELAALDGARLASTFAKLARAHEASYVGTIWRTLRAIARHAAERGWIGQVPWGSWRPRKAGGGASRPPRECCRDERELRRLLEHAYRADTHPEGWGAIAPGPYRALRAKIAAGAMLGLRQGELAGLRWHDVDEARGVVSVVRQWAGAPIKAKERAEVAASHRELFGYLRWHRAETAALLGREPGPDEPLFPAPSGGHYAAGECLATRDLRQCVESAHLNEPLRWSPHSLRDTFVTLASRAHRGDLVKLAQLARHASVSSLVRYLRAWERSHGVVLVEPRPLPELPP
jgi:integrase